MDSIGDSCSVTTRPRAVGVGAAAGEHVGRRVEPLDVEAAGAQVEQRVAVAAAELQRRLARATDEPEVGRRVGRAATTAAARTGRRPAPCRRAPARPGPPDEHGSDRAQRWRSTSATAAPDRTSSSISTRHPRGAGAQLEVAHRPRDRRRRSRRAAPTGSTTSPAPTRATASALAGCSRPSGRQTSGRPWREPGQDGAEPGVGHDRGRPREHRGVAHVAAQLHAVGDVEVGRDRGGRRG